MTTERLDRIENDIDVVRQLLTSAATYAESANRKVDQLATKVDQLTTKIDELTTVQGRTQEQLEELTTAQRSTQTQLDQLSSRVDEFVFQSQRIFNQQATVLERADGRSERLEAIVQRLDRNYEEQKSQFQEFQTTTNAALERIDRVLDYLLRKQSE